MVRASAGQGWRMDSSGRVARLLNGGGGIASGREQAVRGRVAARATSEGASHGGSGAGVAGSVSNRRRGDPAVRLAAAIGDPVRRGKSERQRKVERLPFKDGAAGREMPCLG